MSLNVLVKIQPNGLQITEKVKGDNFHEQNMEYKERNNIFNG